MEDGKKVTKYVVGTKTTNVNMVDDSTVEIKHGGSIRSYLANSPKLDDSGSDFYMPKLIGGSISVDVDLSEAGCSCNAAWYLTKMPGKVFTDNGDWYCDAQPTAPTVCTEMDLMEANIWAFQSTPHTAGDGSGKCWQKGHHTGRYGPGKDIDTAYKFTVKSQFNTEGNGWTTFMIQDDK
jgi:hypothetical protein